MRKKILKDRYYKRILLVLLIICAIPIMLLGGSIINLVTRQKGELYEAQQANVNNIVNQFEIIFEFVENGMIRTALKGETSAVVNLSRDAANFQKFNSMRDELQLILSSELSMDEIFLMNMKQKWIMTSTGLTDIEGSGYEDLIHTLVSFPKTSFWYSDDAYIYLAKRIPINTYSNSCMMVARFNKRDLERNILGQYDELSAIVLDRDGNIVLGQENSGILNYVRTDEHQNERLQAGEQAKISFHGESYVLVSAQSMYNKWHYILVVSEARINQGLKQVLFTLLLVFLSLIVLEAYVVYICSKKLYTPIDEINMVMERGIQGEERMEGLEQESDVKEKLQYIVDRNVKLKRELSSHRMSSQQLFLRKVYQGELNGLSEDEFIRRGIASENLPGSNMHVLAIKYNEGFTAAPDSKTDSVPDKPGSPQDQELYMFALCNIVSELLGNEEIFPVVSIGRVVYVTYYMDSFSEEGANVKLQAASGMIIETVSRYLNRQVNIGISRSFYHISEIGNAVEECMRALQDIIGTDGRYRFYNHNDSPVSAFSDNKVRQSRLKVLQAVAGADEGTCREALHEYFQAIQMMNYYLLKLELGKLVSEILDYYAEYAVIPDYERVGDIVDFDITKEVNSIDKLKHYVWDYLLAPLMQQISQPADSSRLISQIVEYLNDNIEKDISLEQCARDFNYNPNYLSRMFKKQFGQNYTDYVIAKKMERCKELLLHSNITVNELTERFGYSCPQNFIRVFKKYTLMTPGQFRKQYKEKDKM